MKADVETKNHTYKREVTILETDIASICVGEQVKVHGIGGVIDKNM
jgi:hypothetical protein